MIVKLLTEHHLEFLSLAGILLEYFMTVKVLTEHHLRVSKLKRRLYRLV